MVATKTPETSVEPTALRETSPGTKNDLETLRTTMEELRINVEDLKSRLFWNQLDVRTWRWVAIGISVFLLMVLVAMVLHQADVVRFASLSAVVPEVNVGKEKGDFRDLLTILVPIFAAAIVFIVSAAGMRRLQTYDEEFARAREERRQDQKDLREELRNTLKDQQQKALARIQVRQESLDVVIKNQMEEEKGKLQKFSEGLQNQLTQGNEGKFSEIRRLAQDLDEKFGFLKNFTAAQKLAVGNAVSLGVLHADVSRHFAEDRPKEACDLVVHALERKADLHGTPNDWFNLSAELGRQDREALALQVCEAALDRYAAEGVADNQDLLAHAIHFAAKIGQWDQTKEYLARAEKIGRERWAWRLFIFVGDYFELIGDIEAFMRVNEDFKTYLPLDELPYLQIAGYWSRRSQPLKALEIIKEGLQKLGRPAPRLALRGADLSLELRKYADVLKYCGLALEGAAEDSPGISQGSVVFTQACALDGLFFQALNHHDHSDQEIPKPERVHLKQMAERALRAYQDYEQNFKSDGMLLKIEQAKIRQRVLRHTIDMHDLGELTVPVAPSEEEQKTQRDLSASQASRLAEQIAEQINESEIDLSSGKEMLAGLANRLRNDFTETGREKLRQALIAWAEKSANGESASVLLYLADQLKS